MSDTAVVTWEIHFHVTDRIRRDQKRQDLEVLKRRLTEMRFDYLVDDEIISCMVSSLCVMMDVVDLFRRDEISAISCGVQDIVDGIQVRARSSLGWDLDLETGAIELGPRG